MQEVFSKIIEELKSEAKRWEDSGTEYKDKCEIAVGRGLRNAIEIVKQEAEKYNNGWIPVSERMPDVCGYPVMLTVENAFGQRSVCKAFTNYMKEGELLFYTNEKEYCQQLTSSILSDSWKPIAWQPLPAPYRTTRESCSNRHENRYLYRAKLKNWRELPKEVWWVEGYYAFIDNHHYIYTGNPYYGGLYVAAERYEIDRDNLCACTGLKDKNGKLIWENDVVEMYDRNTDYRWRAVVTFGNPNGEYTCGWQLKPIGECEANKDILCWIDMEESGAFCEVIGNIFDNPDLFALWTGCRN